MKVLLAAINSKYIHSNLAVYSLKAYAGIDDERICICEYTINNLIEEIIDGIYEQKPDVLAFSCYIWNISYVKKIVREIKKILPYVKIWLGGPEAYYNSKMLMESLPDVDLIIKGEGEATFKELVELFFENGDMLSELNEKLVQIAGIDVRMLNGEIVSTMPRAALNMSDIPFPYKNIADFNNKIIYYESSRGCPFSCSYCLSSVEKSLRFRDVELVKKELKMFIDAGVSQVKFVDRTFNCKKKHAMEIWQFILDNDNGFTNFHFEIAADLIDDEEIELISKMRKGLIQLEIGVQSTNMETIKEIHRVMDIDKVRNVVAKINAFKNTHQHLDLIAGLPYEDVESFKNSFNEVYSMRPYELQLGFLKVLAGSYMYEQKDNYEIKYKEFEPYELFSTKWISYDDILMLKGVEEMVEVYYNSLQFPLTIRLLETYFETPFELYYELSKYYENHFDKSMKHSRISRYNILLDFIKDSFDEQAVAKVKLLMTFDVYLRENAKSRPAFAKDLSDYKNEIRVFAKSNELRKDEHIEIITEKEMNVLEGIDFDKYLNVEYRDRNEVLEVQEIFISFDYNDIDPVNHTCKITIWR